METEIYTGTSVKTGERGQITIPKYIRDKFSLVPATELDFEICNGSIVLKKSPKKMELTKWKGRCKNSFAELGCDSVDAFIEDVRGR
jgi:AbrB family looped-hinge helix DNA binding protein